MWRDELEKKAKFSLIRNQSGKEAWPEDKKVVDELCKAENYIIKQLILIETFKNDFIRRSKKT